MSVDTTMAILYAQTGLAAPFANAAAVGPQAAAAMSRMLATEMAKLEQQQIEKVETTEKPNVSSDGRKGGRRGFGRHRHQHFAKQVEQEQPRPSESPLVGNLLNMKV